MSSETGVGGSSGGLAWLPWLLQTNDSIFPSGAYAHSFGLEGMTHLDLVKDAVSLRTFLFETAIPALEQVDLPFVRHAYEAARDGDGERLEYLDDCCAAMKGSRELRLASSRIGTQRLHMLLQLGGSSPALQHLEAARQAGRAEAHAAIVFGAQMAAQQTPLEAALIAYFYQALAAFVSAAMKLLRMGQMAAQTLLTECLARAEGAARTAQSVAVEDVGWFQPALDIASAQHETAYTRIFIS